MLYFQGFEDAVVFTMRVRAASAGCRSGTVRARFPLCRVSSKALTSDSAAQIVCRRARCASGLLHQMPERHPAFAAVRPPCKKVSFVLYFQRPSKKGATNDMGKYTTNSAAGAQTIETLGGDYALKWDDETQMGVNAHAALLSQFAKAGGFFDRLVETCPMQLTSNNAPEVRDLIATVMVSMVNGTTRFRHFDRLHIRPSRSAQAT